MTALVIRARSRLTNPLPGTPVLPDVSTDLYFNFDARDLEYQDGDTVYSWLASGVAPVNNRLLNTAQSDSNWELPTFSKSAGPNSSAAVVFNGVNQRIRVTNNKVVPYEGPFTIAVVGRGVAPDGVTLSRMYGSSIGMTTHISPASTGNIVFQQGGGNVFSTPNPMTHFVAVASVSNDQIIMMTSAMREPESVAGAFEPGYLGFGLGGSSSVALGSQFQGAVSRVTAFTRALTANDVAALVYAYREEYGI